MRPARGAVAAAPRTFGDRPMGSLRLARKAYRGAYATGGSIMCRLNTRNPMAVGFGFSRAGGKNSAVRFGIAGKF